MARPAPGASLSACRFQKTHPNLHTAGCRLFPWSGASFAAGRWLRRSNQPAPPSSAAWPCGCQRAGTPAGSRQLPCPQMLVAAAALDRGLSLGEDLGKPAAGVRGVPNNTLTGSDNLIKWGFSQGCKDFSISLTQSVWYTTWTNWRIKTIWSLQQMQKKLLIKCNIHVRLKKKISPECGSRGNNT